MSDRRQWWLVGAVLLVAAGGLFVATRALSDELTIVSIGSRAPEFSAVTVDSAAAPRTLESYRGDVVILNVWATWCTPCRVEMPSLEALHRDFREKGLRVVAVSVDEPGSADAIRAFAREYALTFDILHDPSKAIQRSYLTTGVPETFVIGRDGTIRRKVIGAMDWNSADSRAVLTQLLSEATR